MIPALLEQFPELTDIDLGALKIDEYFEIEHISALPGDDISCPEWAEKYRIMDAQTSAISGPWRNELYPHSADLMTAMTSAAVSEVIIAGATQLSKTESYLNVIGYLIHKRPAPIMWALPNEDKALEIYNDRLVPMIDSSRDGILKKLCTEDGRKIKSDGLSFVGGKLYLAWGGSAKTMSSRSVQYVFIDEEDEMELLKKYGHPVPLLKERLKGFINTVIIRAGKTMKKDGIYAAAKSAEYLFYRYVACPHCGGEFHFVKEGLRPENITKDAFRGGAYYECPHCGGAITEKNRRDMLRTARFMTESGEDLYDVLRTGNRLTIAFNINSFYSPFISFDKMMTEYLSAESSTIPGAMKVFYEGYLAIPYETVSKVDSKLLSAVKNRRIAYSFKRLPAGVCALTAAVDVQGNRLEVLVKGWGLRFENWHIRHQILWGAPETDLAWSQLDEFLAYKYEHPCGIALPVICTLVDSSAYTEFVYAYTEPREALNVFSIKGSSTTKAPLVSSPSTAPNSTARLYTVNPHILKKTVYQWLKKTAEAIISEKPLTDCVGFMHFNKDCDDSYFAQLTAETLVNENEKNEHFENPGKKRNEILDLHGYNYAALHISKINLQDWATEIRRLMGGTNE